MQYFDRTTVPPPDILQSDAAGHARAAMRDFMMFGEEKRSQTNVPLSSLQLDDSSMRDGLYRLFQGRCAFCEAQDKLSPYRFRPPAEAVPVQDPQRGHLYYAWLENAWQNIYAICPSCRPAQTNYFPVSGARVALPSSQVLDRYVQDNTGMWPASAFDKPVFLDPCGDKSFQTFLWPQTDGALYGDKKRGNPTIAQFNLNAMERVSQRKQAYRRYFEMLRATLSAPKAELPEATSAFKFAGMEFGGTWYLLLRRMAFIVGAELGIKPTVPRSRIERFYMTLQGKPGTLRRLDAAWEELGNDRDRPFEPPVPSVPAMPG